MQRSTPWACRASGRETVRLFLLNRNVGARTAAVSPGIIGRHRCPAIQWTRTAWIAHGLARKRDCGAACGVRTLKTHRCRRTHALGATKAIAAPSGSFNIGRRLTVMACAAGGDRPIRSLRDAGQRDDWSADVVGHGRTCFTTANRTLRYTELAHALMDRRGENHDRTT